MSLIENLDKDHWGKFLRPMFGYTLDVLKNDRFRSVRNVEKLSCNRMNCH